MSITKRPIFLAAAACVGLVVARASAETTPEATSTTATATAPAATGASTKAAAPAADTTAATETTEAVKTEEPKADPVKVEPPKAEAAAAKVAAALPEPKKNMGDETLMEMWERMGLGARLIVIALIVMGIASLGVFFERVYALRRSRKASDTFAPKAEALLDAKSYDQLRSLSENHQKSHLAWLVGEGITAYVDGVRKPGALTPVELARRAMEREMESVTSDLKRGMSVLATVGSIAPFVGLLGTVVGIIAAFKKIGITGSAGLDTVAGDISEALVVTALGLLIAIPAVLLFNYLTAKIDAATLVLDHARGELNDQLETGHAIPHTQMHAKHAAADGEYSLGKAVDVRPA